MRARAASTPDVWDGAYRGEGRGAHEVHKQHPPGVGGAVWSDPGGGEPLVHDRAEPNRVLSPRTLSCKVERHQSRVWLTNRS